MCYLVLTINDKLSPLWETITVLWLHNLFYHWKGHNESNCNLNAPWPNIQEPQVWIHHSRRKWKKHTSKRTYVRNISSRINRKFKMEAVIGLSDFHVSYSMIFINISFFFENKSNFFELLAFYGQHQTWWISCVLHLFWNSIRRQVFDVWIFFKNPFLVFFQKFLTLYLKFLTK